MIIRPPENRVEFILNLAWYRQFLEENGLGAELTVRDFLASIASPLVHWHDECKHCHRVLVNFEGEHSTGPRLPWFHSEGPRGCRAASFERDGDWDESLAARLQACPIGNWEADDSGTCHVCRVSSAAREEALA